ncbi:MAG: recombinase zinc beta ribbon domain-containing protein, partial [Oligoflexales bacterium]|nr:recombinase zinc beta ribbon domain-containing protein [Oligoflexales bacterium]
MDRTPFASLIFSSEFPSIFMKCGECGHAITGESVLKHSGKTYVYYRCANPKCMEHKKRVVQDDLFKQLVLAFEPLNRWTPKATEQFIQ